MKKSSRNRIVLFLVMLVFGAIFYYMLTDTSGSERYTKEIREERTKKDRFFKTSSESPLKDADKDSFKGLKYYDPNPDYRVRARLTRMDANDFISIPMTDGEEKKYRRIGYIDFNLKGSSQQLILLENEDGDYFLPFYDETSSRETYGGGRFLELSPVDGKGIWLDFNHAYTPFCAFNEDFLCPIPPKENQITVSVKAGERYDHK